VLDAKRVLDAKGLDARGIALLGTRKLQSRSEKPARRAGVEQHWRRLVAANGETRSSNSENQGAAVKEADHGFAAVSLAGFTA
jgi:hypothetical protein